MLQTIEDILVFADDHIQTVGAVILTDAGEASADPFFDGGEFPDDGPELPFTGI